MLRLTLSALGLSIIFLAASHAADKPARGSMHLIGGNWFQYAGESADGAPLWVYPHLEGVSEIFREDGVIWTGTLETRFNSHTGQFANLFNAAEVLNELLAAGNNDARTQAARLLGLFIALHRASDPPYYLRVHLNAINERLREPERQWIQSARDFYARTLTGLEAGPRLPALAHPAAALDAPEYYRRMIQDGYLDIAVVGGNLYAKETGTYNSMKFIEDFQARILKQGFRPMPFRASPDRTLLTKTVSLLGMGVIVRLNCTGGSSRDPRIRRGVANFVEGLANADIFIYHGHSNLLSGTYYISETGSDYSRFQIGMNDQSDLLQKCYGLNARQHQIVAFQSCSSYEKYCRPVRWFFEDRLTDARGNAGFIGNSELCYQIEFPPRYAALVEALLEGKGARDIQQKVNAIRLDPKSPHLLLRGVLQPRFSFIVPRGVEIGAIEELNNRDYNLVTGKGSDGKFYVSSEMFPQNRAGELIQILPLADGVYGLMDDGRVFECSRQSGGAMVESSFSKPGKLRFTFLTAIRDGAETTVVLLGKDGVFCVARDGQLLRAPWQPPKGIVFTALGSSGSVLAATDSNGQHYRWLPEHRRFAPAAETPPFDDATPSLAGHGVPGALWTKKDRP